MEKLIKMKIKVYSKTEDGRQNILLSWFLSCMESDLVSESSFYLKLKSLWCMLKTVLNLNHVPGLMISFHYDEALAGTE